MTDHAEPLPYATPPPLGPRAPRIDVFIGIAAIMPLTLSCLLGIPGGPADWWEGHPSIANAVGIVIFVVFGLQFVTLICRLVVICRRRYRVTGWLVTACIINGLLIVGLIAFILEPANPTLTP